MRFIFLLLVSFVFTATAPARADDPALPAPLADMAAAGTAMKYLGRDLGYDGWLAIKDGQEQYFYATPDGSAIFLGVLFNKNGRAITYDQMKRLQGKKDPIFDDLINAPSQKTKPVANALTTTSTEPRATETRVASPAQEFLADVLKGHAFTMGAAQAPDIYMFVDPLCPHCKDMLRVLRPAVRGGKLRIHVLMVGALFPESGPLAVHVVGSTDPTAALDAIMAGNRPTLAKDAHTSTPDLDANLAILKKWKFEGTPITVYRAKDNTIKLLQGAAAKADLILNDLP